MQVNVLGTIYSIRKSNKLEDLNLDRNDGYCDFSIKEIVIDTFQDSPGSMKDLNEYEKQVIRHELIHAFLFESGLDSCTWAKNEEIVDWMSLQFPKLQKVFEQVNAL